MHRSAAGTAAVISRECAGCCGADRRGDGTSAVSGQGRRALKRAGGAAAVAALLVRLAIVLLQSWPSGSAAAADFDALARLHICAHSIDGSSAPADDTGQGDHACCDQCVALHAPILPPPAATSFQLPQRTALTARSLRGGPAFAPPRPALADARPRAPPSLV